MDREHEVKEKLLKENYDVIINENDGGLITLDEIKELLLHWHGKEKMSNPKMFGEKCLTLGGV